MKWFDNYLTNTKILAKSNESWHSRLTPVPGMHADQGFSFLCSLSRPLGMLPLTRRFLSSECTVWPLDAVGVVPWKTSRYVYISSSLLSIPWSHRPWNGWGWEGPHSPPHSPPTAPCEGCLPHSPLQGPSVALGTSRCGAHAALGSAEASALWAKNCFSVGVLAFLKVTRFALHCEFENWSPSQQQRCGKRDLRAERVIEIGIS